MPAIKPPPSDDSVEAGLAAALVRLRCCWLRLERCWRFLAWFEVAEGWLATK